MHCARARIALSSARVSPPIYGSSCLRLRNRRCHRLQYLDRRLRRRRSRYSRLAVTSGSPRELATARLHGPVRRCARGARRSQEVGAVRTLVFYAAAVALFIAGAWWRDTRKGDQ